MKELFREAHKMTREMKGKYPEVDYQTQFGLNLSYLLENKKEEEEMTMEKWYEELSGSEKSRMKDIFENRTMLKSVEEKEEIWNQLLEEKYQNYLEEIKKVEKRKEENKEIEKVEEEQYQKDLARGIATIELYESNKYQCWVAEITGTDTQYGFARKFINPTKIQGNYKYYKLQEGKIYNYLNKNQQHFVKVVNSKLIEMTQAEVKEEDEMKELKGTPKQIKRAKEIRADQMESYNRFQERWIEKRKAEGNQEELDYIAELTKKIEAINNAQTWIDIHQADITLHQLLVPKRRKGVLERMELYNISL